MVWNKSGNIRGQGITGLAAASKVVYLGHSLVADGGASIVDRGWANILSALLRSSDVNFAKGGAVLGWANVNDKPFEVTQIPPAPNTGDGGYATVLNALHVTTRGLNWKGAWAAGTTYGPGDAVWTGAMGNARFWRATSTTTGNDPTTDGQAHWTEILNANVGIYSAMPQLVVASYGLNDLGWGKDYTKFQRVLDLLCSRIIAGRWWDANHPHLAVSAGMAAAGAPTAVDGVFRAFTNAAVGDTATYQIPIDWPGGTVRFVFGQSFQNLGGKVMLTVDGADIREIDFATDRTYSSGVNAQRMIEWPEALAVGAGAHTVGFRVTQAFPAAAPNAWLNGLSFDSPTPPPFVFVGLHKPLTYAAYTAPLPTDADVDAWNTNIANFLAANYPTAIFVNPTSMQDKDATKFYYDSLHPNDKGHRAMAVQVFEAILSALTSDDAAALVSDEPRLGQTFFAKFGNGAAHFSVPQNNTWTDLAPNGNLVEAYIAAEPGDILEIDMTALWNAGPNSAQCFVDFVTIVNGVRTNYVSSGNATQFANGIAALASPINAVQSSGGAPLPENNYTPVCPSTQHYMVMPNDIAIGGFVTVRCILRNVSIGSGTTGARLVLAGAGQQVDLCVKNLGPQDALRPGSVL